MIDDFDAEYGYSISDLTHSYSKRAYKVPEYDLHSIGEIERCVQTCSYGDRLECLEHMQYLEDLDRRLLFIAIAEEHEGVKNWELHAIRDRIKLLLERLSDLSRNLGDTLIYT